MKCYLRMGDDCLEEATRQETVGHAKREFLRVAEELDRYGQTIEASIHIPGDGGVVVEYPDLVLSLGPRGGLKCERT